ncbi:hypothetical protein FQN50_009540 [Emmonsiellopsis sp. PD_5]|nr:hypothetical protein FQN50_009540 [Emmonsiellopsis sp. PD_5]
MERSTGPSSFKGSGGPTSQTMLPPRGQHTAQGRRLCRQTVPDTVPELAEAHALVAFARSAQRNAEGDHSEMNGKFQVHAEICVTLRLNSRSVRFNVFYSGAEALRRDGWSKQALARPISAKNEAVLAFNLLANAISKSRQHVKLRSTDIRTATSQDFSHLRYICPVQTMKPHALGQTYCVLKKESLWKRPL